MTTSILIYSRCFHDRTRPEEQVEVGCPTALAWTRRVSALDVLKNVEFLGKAHVCTRSSTSTMSNKHNTQQLMPMTWRIQITDFRSVVSPVLDSRPSSWLYSRVATRTTRTSARASATST
eukprot:scaffold401789_cov17-Prasinocladus_malaysianus.AAC.1